MENNNDEKVVVFDDEKHILLDHDYDGIKELNHPLPSWWVTTFILTVCFSFPYFVYYVMTKGPTLKQEYVQEMAMIKEKQDAYEAKQGKFSDDKYNAFVAGIDENKKIAKVYKRKCSACHARDGGGGIGPNLTDNYWLHGNKPEAIFKVIDKGVVDKGMQAWGQVLSRDEIYQMTAYVLQFQGKTAADPKAPQGEKY
jgi:cytochrome c oxidase cbb3-type subunit 3